MKGAMTLVVLVALAAMGLMALGVTLRRRRGH
jgi:hypothetical protein